MKVSGKGGQPMPSAETARLNKASGENASDVKKGSRHDEAFAANAASSTRVDLSRRAQDIKRAKELATPSENDVDEAKVARLRKLIDEGNYKVDAEKIADRLVDEHLLTSS